MVTISNDITGIMGILFDISQFKWAESVQRRRVEEALEAKRQQEKYWFALLVATTKVTNTKQLHRYDITRTSQSTLSRRAVR
jgi:hypothetical protein